VGTIPILGTGKLDLRGIETLAISMAASADAETDVERQKP
jgi:hypothetical protein